MAAPRVKACNAALAGDIDVLSAVIAAIIRGEEGYPHMCCFVASLFMLGPRAAILIWYLIQPVRWNETFDTFLWPVVGFLIAPWTTLMYVAVYPGGIEGLDIVFLAAAVAIDVFSWFGGGYTNRNRLPTSAA
jgi:hypothetical protein